MTTEDINVFCKLHTHWAKNYEITDNSILLIIRKFTTEIFKYFIKIKLHYTPSKLFIVIFKKSYINNKTLIRENLWLTNILNFEIKQKIIIISLLACLWFRTYLFTSFISTILISKQKNKSPHKRIQWYLLQNNLTQKKLTLFWNWLTRYRYVHKTCTVHFK